MHTVHPWSRILFTTGNIAMLVGAIDPMEGSLLILPASGLVALGSYLGHGERRFITYRIWVFFLITIGVMALWGLSGAGGFGGSSGRSIWWGLLVLPYLIGWSMGIWGADSPRWMLWLGLAVGLWYLALLVMVLNATRLDEASAVGLVLGAIGVLTISGCIYRLRKGSFASRS